MARSQSLISTYAPRLAQYQNALYTPVMPTASNVPASRTTKRGTTIINYADDAYDDDDFEEAEGRRPTGLRSLRRDDQGIRENFGEKLGKEIDHQVDVQGLFRDWMTRRTVKPPTDQQVHTQAQLPLTLIPIRLDIDVPAAPRDAPFPLTQRAAEAGYHNDLAGFKRPDPSPAYKLRDVFLWNLHEALLTPDDFARTLTTELDLPNRTVLQMMISNQIRTQLEEYAGVAMHPLFHNQSKPPPAAELNTATPNAPSASPDAPASAAGTPLANGAHVESRATLVPPSDNLDTLLNQDDTYRCIISISVSLSSRLYTDKFEWNLLHPPGAAEMFARQTCADLGLSGEWVIAISHAIYEAVLQLKKEVCGGSMLLTGEIDNQAVRAEEGAGWRYDAEDFGAEWEPKLEVLSKEDIEKREGDRERQLRRLRRETARFSSISGMQPSAREEEAKSRASYFDLPGGPGTDNENVNMGRGERSKKKRRFRSLSPVAKALNSPAEGASGAGAGWGGAENKLTEAERQSWRCSWCYVWGSGIWAVRDGPAGPRTLCNNCGLMFERDKKLPPWSEAVHRHDVQIKGTG